MKNKRSTALLLAMLMIASVFLNVTSVFAEGEEPSPELNQPIEEVEVKDKKDALEEVKAEEEKDTEKTEANEELNEKDGLEISEEEMPEAVGVPDGFDLSTINTIAKDNNGNYYGVKTYGNGSDTSISKVFYNITKEQYDKVSEDCFMIFRRNDGEAFRFTKALLGGDHIIDGSGNTYGLPEAGTIFTEMQFRHHMAYRMSIALNNRDTVNSEELKDVFWRIELKKDWVIDIENGYGREDEDGSNSPAYIYFNCILEGNNHRIYRNYREKGDNFVVRVGTGVAGNKIVGTKTIMKNLTIDGSNEYACLDVEKDGSVVLNDVKIINGKTDNANLSGGITLKDNSSLNMDAKSSINGCKSNFGGAIYMYGDNVTANISGNLSNNQADLGGAICSLDENSTINVNGASFDGNKAVKTKDGKYLNGGAIYSQSNLNVEDSKFTKNSADGNGGAIYSYKAYTIKDSEFKNNNSKKSGGAIYAPKDAPVTIIDTTFSENEAKWGGAIANYAKSNIKNATFDKNEATYNGGAIYTGEGMTIEESSLVENKTQQGGGIYIAKNATNPTKVSNTSFEKNSVTSSGAGIFVSNNSKLEVSGSTFTKNEAPWGAGISSAADGDVNNNLTNIKVESSTFAENEALMGAGIFTAFPTEITNSTFTKNQALVHPQDDQTNPHDSGVGGAIRVMDNKTTIKGSTFEDNFAGGSGGAIGINGVARDEDKDITTIKENIKVEISDNTQFIANICGVGQGGAIYTIPYLYDIEGYETDVDEDTLKAKAYQNLTTADDTVFKDNIALSGFVDPPTNYAKYTNLLFARNSFTETLSNEDVAKSLLNNYDVNYKNKKLSALFDPNGGEFKTGDNPKDIRVINEEAEKEITLLDAPKRDGYKFTGWKCSMNIPEEILKGLPEELIGNLNEGKIFKAGDKFKLDSNYIFIAQWEKEEPKPEPKPQENVFTPFFFSTPALNKEDHYQYLIGYSDDTFRPENNMTREEVAVMFSRLLKNPPAKGAVYKYNFNDVERERWSITAISYMSEMGIIKGYPDGTFRPQASITRAEFASIATKFAELTEGNKTFNDLGKDHWAYDLVSRAATAGWINGYPDGSFKPDNKITRAEVVSITNLMLNRKADEKYVDTNLDKLLKYSDVTKNHWAYYKIFEATNGHDFVRDRNKIDEEWKDVTNKSFVYDK